MTASAVSFARAAPGVKSARAPEQSDNPFRGCEYLHVYTGRLVDVEGDVLLVVLAPDGAESRRRAFLDAIVTWESDQIESCATVLGRGETPRPWVALDVHDAESTAQVAGSLAVSEVTAVLEDAAEAFHVLSRRPGYPLPLPEHVVVQRRPPGARVLPPLDQVGQDSDPERQLTDETDDVPGPERQAVTRLGMLGYELLSGDSPPSDGGTETAATSLRIEGSQVGDGASQTVQVVERALAPGNSYRSPYELKRALLFGREEATRTDRRRDAGKTSDAGATGGRATDGGDPAGGAASDSPDEEEPPEPVTRADRPEQLVGRRKAVGLLGIGLLTVGGASAIQSTLGGGSEQQAGGESEIQIPDADFDFKADLATINIKHAAGDRIEAGRLFIRRPRVSGIDHLAWSDYPGFTDQSTVWVGDSVTIDRGAPMGASMIWDRPGEDEFVIIDEYPDR